ncbi:transposase [Polynucleobacter sp. AP-Sving-400A-A2]|uniref:transposase n=1 Tax=Polynucleobacter sp. AP-Sving-400A-A2 TaxID=2081049 RepID=UPI001BFD0F1B|nr:transposase [Polynucleobacter sp. AP-Sving-400A-A2]QWE14668.1 transposase [Polynucleobacter sp. AP-Sving-400A-A2]
MVRQARTIIPGQAMHVMVRGNNRETLFFGNVDRRIYLDWLREAAKQFGSAVHAFALMPNHVHLLVTPKNADSLAKTMQSLGRRYAQYFNQQQHRSGTIWEGRYRSSLIDPDYFLRCQRFIELNPVRSGFESSSQASTWTSFASHIGDNAEPWLVDHQHFWNLGNTPFERQMRWAAFVKEGAPHWEDQQITEALVRSKPWISDSYAKKLFKDNPEQVLIRRRGRPKKININ